MNASTSTLTLATSDTVKGELNLNTTEMLFQQQPSRTMLDKVEQTVGQLMAIGERDLTAQRDMAQSITSLAERPCKELAQRSQMLKTPLHTLVNDAESGGQTANTLLALQEQVSAVNPNRMDFTMSTVRRLLSFLPFVGTPIAKWFARYQTAEGVINDIVNTLRDGEAQLKRDNLTLEEDQIRYRELTFTLEDYIKFGHLLDQRVEQAIADQDTQAAKQKYLQEHILFPLRQRIMDLQQTLAVNQQAVITAEVIIQNNKELIRGVNRAINVTVTALETASVMSIALQHQKKLLDATQAVNNTTNELIVQTSEQLKTQGVAIQKQASESQLDIQKLKQAFNNIESALQDISQYRQKALPQMAHSILEMDQLTSKMEQSIQDMEQGKSAQANFANTIEL
ncbi:toxic anion resistance protein [Motilimonas eburnea]|uniref:toxic anion resistance protein n=1 Tax=Motilimonas eburnea TaxID=1737488 RepID=UPI001E3C0452|nr:toxic anion resistance protein [Motilimonas eburnea]MCE2571366.1 toxic anion resistance protein [Motilimonas eburnea]